jgi:SAM-dependent methyltransferase
VPEVIAAATVARVLTLMRLTPGGVGLADAVLVALLVSVGASPAAALGTALLWRLGMAAAWLPVLTRRTQQREREELFRLDGPTGSALGELVHRTAFGVLGSLPPTLARAVRRLAFQVLFLLADDPWSFGSLAYEARKRACLVKNVPGGATTIVELGCADGHNLIALAERNPEADVIGIDISPRAVEIARHRAAGRPNIVVLLSDIRGAADALRSGGVTKVDTLVLAEVLYYLGGRERIAAELEGVADLLIDGSHVVLLHPSQDAERLHPAASDVLTAPIQTAQRVGDPARPFVVEIGVRANKT